MPEDPRPYAVFGDAAGAAILGPGDGSTGVLGSHLGNDGALRYSVTLAHQPPFAAKETMRFGRSNATIADEAMSGLLASSRSAMQQAGITIGDVRWVFMHQANGVIFREAMDALGIGSDRVMPVVAEIGSVGCASVPVSLDRARKAGLVRPGDLVLMAAVGSGLSHGAVVYRA